MDRYAHERLKEFLIPKILFILFLYAVNHLHEQTLKLQLNGSWIEKISAEILCVESKNFANF